MWVTGVDALAAVRLRVVRYLVAEFEVEATEICCKSGRRLDHKRSVGALREKMLDIVAAITR